MSEIIKLYRKVCEVVPDGKEPRKPLAQPRIEKIIFNLNEIELYYNEHFGFYIPAKKYVKGGDHDSKIVVIDGGSEDLLDYLR